VSVVPSEPDALTVTQSPLFLGREREIAQLDRVLRSASDGDMSWALLSGEEGIGKTRLLSELSGRAEKNEFIVVRAHGERRVGSRRRGLAPPQPGAGDMAANTDGQGSLNWMSHLIDAGPVLLIVDDVQWLDDASFDAIVEFGKRQAGERFALVMGCRDNLEYLNGRFGYDMADILTDGAPIRIRLPGLDDDVLARLATEMIGFPPGDGLRRTLAEVDGNPLLCIELLEGLCAERLLTVEDDSVELLGRDLPWRTRSRVLCGVREFKPATLHALRVASVLGDRFRVAHLALVADRSTADLLLALDEAIAAGALDEDGDCLKFRHRLLRRALYEGIAAPIRSSMHLDAGRKLAAVGMSAEETGQHFLLGALPGDMTAVTPLIEAARESAYNPPVAVELLERALAITPQTDARWNTLVTELIEASVWCGRLSKAQALSRDALARSRDTDARTVLGLIEYLGGAAPAPARRTSATTGVTESGHGDDLARVLDLWGMVLDGDLDSAERRARTVRHDGAGTPGGIVDCATVGAEIMVNLARGRPHRALTMAERQVRQCTGRESGMPAALWPAHLFLAMTLRDLDRFDDAEAVARLGCLRAEQLGVDIVLPFYRYELSELYFHAGKTEKALHVIESAVDEANGMGVGALTVRARLRRVRILLHSNDLRGAHRELATAEADLADIGGRVSVTYALLCARAEIADAEGDLEVAHAFLERAWQLCLDTGLVSNMIELAADEARLARAVGEHNRTVQIAEDLSAAISGSAIAARPRTRVAVLMTRAFALEDQPELALEAADEARSVGRPWLRAVACERMAELVTNPGRRDDAISMLKDSLSGYEGLSATRDAARVRAALRERGVRSRRCAKRRTVGDSPYVRFTSTELEVLRLLVQGETNRTVATQMFISPRTVETHISHMFLKLGVSSRTGLVTAAAELGIPMRPPDQER
jgi:DNA-binding CsgD family transcriptional regulator/tetratricopeptide (TPR) repeat protein